MKRALIAIKVIIFTLRTYGFIPREDWMGLLKILSGKLTKTKVRMPKIPKTIKKPRHLEDDLQVAVMTWLKLQHPGVLAFHVPNGGQRNAREGARLKAQGVMPGVADILIFSWAMTYWPQQKWMNNYGLALELKIKPNKQSDAQKTFENAIKCVGWQYEVAYDFDEAKKIISDYLAPVK